MVKKTNIQGRGTFMFSSIRIGWRTTWRMGLSALFAFGIGAISFAPNAHAQGAAPYYRGKTIRVIVGGSAGGGYDTFARVISAHMAAHIPGTPTFIIQNMDGAGSLIATNHVNNVGPKDGTEMGALNPQISTDPMFHPDRAKFDPRKLQWIGSALRENHIGIAWTGSPFKTFDEAFKTELVVAGSGGSTNQYPLFTNGLIGTKFKVVSGYPGTKEGFLALERGEVTGNVGITWASLKATEGEWIRDKKVQVFIQFGLTKHPELPGVSWIYDYAKTDDDRAAMDLIFAAQEFGRPYAVAPEVPANVVQILRTAFDDTMKDPEFLADAAKRKLDLDPVGGKDIQAIMDKMYKATPATIARVKGILGDQM
jgi:tripartite-type tricarboxylate transporter receptor subunit TctC